MMKRLIQSSRVLNKKSTSVMFAKSMIQYRSLSDLSGAVVELSNYLEQKISLKTEEFAKVLYYL